METVNEPPNRQIRTVRVFNAPREIVFSAWTNAHVLAKWWGSKGFTNTFHEFDLRPGGNWKFTMHSPNGGNYPNESVYVEIKEPERIILRHVSQPHFQLTACFEEVDDNKTKLIFEQLFDTAEEYNKVKVFAVDANEENMNRLEEVLKHLSNDNVKGQSQKNY
jgi:uncharacterized protein YndB with AHSA1/START domain